MDLRSTGTRTAALALAVALAPGCKNEQELQVVQTINSAAELTAQGRKALASHHFPDAVSLFSQVTVLKPTDPSGWLLLAQAQKQSGNLAGSLMSLKQAETLGATSDPGAKRERAELYKRMGQSQAAMEVFVELRDQNQLTDAETLELAHLQARAGDLEGATASLESVQKRKPDDPEAKAVEAELLLLKGDEVLGARLLDRLVTDVPKQASARISRARYFFANGLAKEALQDLEAVSEDEAQGTELVGLKAQVLLSLKRNDEALKLLQPLSDSHPRDAELSCELAEILLLVGRVEEAEALIDKSLAVKSDFPRALYVRGRSKEVSGDMTGANGDYLEALKADPSFAPALSRSWAIQDHQGQKGEAVSTLERLVALGAASIEEKFSLITMYCDLNDNPTRAKALLADVTRKKPGDPRLKELKARVAKITTTGRKKTGTGIEILRAGKRGH